MEARQGLKREGKMGAAPSTNWREQIPADEAERFKGYVQVMQGIQNKDTAKHGKPGRGLHRKMHLNLPASFTVRDGLPAHARQGLFAEPKTYDAWVRLSNGTGAIRSDKVPDVRGFAFKVRGLNGDGALGNGPTDCQDFLCINSTYISPANAADFVGIVEAVSTSQGALLKYLFKKYGFGIFSAIKRMTANLNKPFTGFASESFHTASPFACGSYAARLRLLPAAKPIATTLPIEDLAGDFAAQLAKGDLKFEVQLQFYVDEKQTPIEDASVDWVESVSPYVTVADLVIAKSALDRARDPAFAAMVEADGFDPWRALAAHKPLGSIMRIRKDVYFASYKNRGGK